MTTEKVYLEIEEIANLINIPCTTIIIMISMKEIESINVLENGKQVLKVPNTEIEKIVELHNSRKPVVTKTKWKSADTWLIHSVITELQKLLDIEVTTAKNLMITSNFYRLLDENPVAAHHESPESWAKIVIQNNGLVVG